MSTKFNIFTWKKTNQIKPKHLTATPERMQVTSKTEKVYLSKLVIAFARAGK